MSIMDHSLYQWRYLKTERHILVLIVFPLRIITLLAELLIVLILQLKYHVLSKDGVSYIYTYMELSNFNNPRWTKYRQYLYYKSIC